MSIFIDKEKCKKCGKCAAVCPGSLIGKNPDGTACMRYPKDCWGCSSCIKECKFGAIALYLGADIGGMGSKMTVNAEDGKLYWNIEKRDGTTEQVVINQKESNPATCRPAALKRNRNNTRRYDNMNTNDLNTALYEKMAAEQDNYRDWLKSQPPEEILHHTYEYTVREDIVMAMEQLELTDAQAQALLDSPSPLADVYRYFEKLETGYMDVIRDSIENRADDVCRAQEELRTAPLYPHSAAYASQHGEMAQYNRSYQANSACKEAIEQAISAHYAENRLDTEAAVKDVLEKFGTERVQFILANTIQRKNYDGRISQDNKAWAKTIPMLEDSGASRHCAYLVVDQVNPGLTDLFTRQFRKVAQEQQKSSVLQKLKQELPAHKSAAPKKREPER